MVALTAEDIQAIYDKHFGAETFDNYIIRDGTQALLHVLLDEITEREGK